MANDIPMKTSPSIRAWYDLLSKIEYTLTRMEAEELLLKKLVEDARIMAVKIFGEDEAEIT